MPKIIKQFTSPEVNALIENKKNKTSIRSLGGGYGLVIAIYKTNSFYKIRYTFHGQQKLFTIGRTDLISYQEAKKKCFELKK